MANFGIGIGSFLDGFVKGANMRNDWDRQAKSDAREDRRLDMAEDKLAYDKTAGDRAYQLDVDRFGYAQKSGDRAYQLQADQFQHTRSIGERQQARLDQTQQWAAEDRAAEAPVKAAERQQQLQGYQDAQTLRDATRAAGEKSIGAFNAAVSAAKASVQEVPSPAAGAQPQFTFNGRTFKTREEADAAVEASVGTLTDHYIRTGVPIIQDAYLRAGDPEKASAYGKWAQNEQVQAGMKDAVRLSVAFERGDWDGVNRHLDSILANTGYMDLSGYEGDATPLKDASGQTVGMRIEYTDKRNGTKFTQEFRDMAEFQQGVLGLVNPQAVFEHNTRQIDAAAAVKAEAAKDSYKTANDILLERAKGEVRQAGKPDPQEEAIRKRIADLERTDGQFAALPGSEKVKRAMADLEAIRAGSQQARGLPPLSGAQPAPNVLRRPLQ